LDFSLHGSDIAIRRVGTPLVDATQPAPRPVAQSMTLQEMQEIDPYEFPVR